VTAPIAASAPRGASAPRQPPALYALFLTEMWERFSFYGMQAILLLYLTDGFGGHRSGRLLGLGLSDPRGTAIVGWYTGAVYVTPVLGGLIADRLLGYRRTVILGAALMAAGHFLMAIERLPVLYVALTLLAIGSGAFKANLSTIVGKLYEENDPRRDRGFTIFYMGINLGALLSPLVCGYLAETVSWGAGFAAAGVGMSIGLVVFLIGGRWLRGIDLGPAGRRRPTEGSTARAALSPVEKRRVVVLLLIFLFAVLFWAGFAQSWLSHLFWARDNTYRPTLPAALGGRQVPASWSQSIEPTFVVLLAPLLSALWMALARRGREPSTPVKMALGLGLMGTCFLVMVVAVAVTGGQQASLAWLFGSFLVMAVSELIFSPVGLSLVTQLAPATIGGVMMGMWFLTNAAGYKLGGVFAGRWDEMAHGRYFGWCAALALAGALAFAALLPRLRRMLASAR
jgi:POT family proton-dependent oligopeptide transporter